MEVYWTNFGEKIGRYSANIHNREEISSVEDTYMLWIAKQEQDGCDMWLILVAIPLYNHYTPSNNLYSEAYFVVYVLYFVIYTTMNR